MAPLWRCESRRCPAQAATTTLLLLLLLMMMMMTAARVARAAATPPSPGASPSPRRSSPRQPCAPPPARWSSPPSTAPSRRCRRPGSRCGGARWARPATRRCAGRPRGRLWVAARRCWSWPTTACCGRSGLRTGGRRGLARCHAAAAPPRPRPARGPPASCGARPTVARSRCSAPRLAARWRAPRCRRAASRRPLHLATWRCWAAVMITCTASRGGGTEERQTSPRCDLFKFRYEAGLRGESPGEEHSARSCPACYAVTCEATTTWMEGGLAAMASGFRAVYAVLPGKLAQHRRHSTRDSACVSKSAPDPADSECATKTRHSRYVPRKNGVHFGSI
mmetsp:Transcript_33570/g.84531  ORF Transcript_33570/g.84531 Transcript_33570/m.84531 type:complete len:336 (+) Transcript_33570:284-1291(+)